MSDTSSDIDSLRNLCVELKAGTYNLDDGEASIILSQLVDEMRLKLEPYHIKNYYSIHCSTHSRILYYRHIDKLCKELSVDNKYYFKIDRNSSYILYARIILDDGIDSFMNYMHMYVYFLNSELALSAPLTIDDIKILSAFTCIWLYQITIPKLSANLESQWTLAKEFNRNINRKIFDVSAYRRLNYMLPYQDISYMHNDIENVVEDIMVPLKDATIKDFIIENTDETLDITDAIANVFVVKKQDIDKRPTVKAIRRVDI